MEINKKNACVIQSCLLANKQKIQPQKCKYFRPEGPALGYTHIWTRFNIIKQML